MQNTQENSDTKSCGLNAELQKFQKEIEDLKKKVNCSTDFRCLNTNFQAGVCKVRDIGVASFVQIVNDDLPITCKFALNFGYSTLCQCPMRVFAAKHMKK